MLPIARVLAAQGARVRVVIPPWDDPGRAGQRWREDQVEVVHTTAGRGPLMGARIVHELLRETRGFAPDVVHCFKPIGYSGAAASILTASARRRGTPLVVVDADDLEGRGGWSGRRGLGLAGAVRGAQEAATLRGAPLATVASQWLRQHAMELGRAAETVLYLPNGHAVEAPPAGRKRAGGNAGGCTREAPTLFWYTRFTEAQPSRIADLVGAILAIVPAARLVVLGEEINPGDRAAAAAAFAAAGLDDRVDWRGFEADAVARWLNERPRELVAIYPLDDDLTNRARCPSKVPQLMALGIPVVAERVGEMSNYLADAAAECLVPPGDRAGFANRVAQLLQNDRSRARVERRLQAAAERWRWEAVAGGLLDWYARRLVPRG